MMPNAFRRAIAPDNILTIKDKQKSNWLPKTTTVTQAYF